MRTRALLVLPLVAALGAGCKANPPVANRGAVITDSKPQPKRLAITTRERWRVPMPGEIVGLPTVVEQEIFLTTNDAVVALDSTGGIKWSTPFPATRVYAPRVDDDLLFVAGHHGALGLRRATGEVVWRFDSGPTDADRVNRPAAVGGLVVLTTVGGRIIGLDRSTGVLRWATEMATEIGADTAVLDGVVVVVGRGEWAAFDAASGNRKWSGDLGLIGTSSPVAFQSEGGSQVAVATDEKLISVNLFDGTVRWHVPAEQSELAQVPVAAGNEILVPDHWGRLTAYRASDGTVLWTADGPDGVAQFGEPALLRERLVALSLDIDGPRLASPDGAVALRPPSPGWGVARLSDGGLVVSTWGDGQNYLVAYDIDLGR